MCHKKNNFLAGEIFFLFVKAILTELQIENYFGTHISILKFCGVNNFILNLEKLKLPMFFVKHYYIDFLFIY